MKNFLSKTFSIVLLLSVMLIGATTLFSENQASAYVDESGEIFYGDAVLLSTTTSTINFSRKVVTVKELAHPNIISNSANSNYDCVATSAANVLFYYDRYKSNLVAGTPGATIGGVYKYNDQLAVAKNLVNSMFSLMNGTSAGISYPTAKTVLNNYVIGKGYTITFSDMKTNGAVDFNKMVTYINASRPVIMLTNGNFALYSMTENANSTNYSIKNYSGDHSVTAFGYKKIEYYNSSNAVIATDYFYKVATDMKDAFLWLKLESTTNVTVAEAIYIK